MTIEQLLALSPEALAVHLQDANNATEVSKLLKSAVSGKVPTGEHMKYEEFIKGLNDIIQKSYSTPTGRAAVTDMIRQQQTERFVRRNKPVFDALLQGADLVTSLSQIRESNKAIKALVKPSLPSANVLDPALNNAIAQAQQGNLEALRALEPAKQEIAQQRLMDMNTARSVSGGQAGAYGAHATAASLRANRAAAGLVPLGDSVRARQQQRADSLIGLRQNVRQNEFNNRMAVARENLGQYQSDVASASALGQAGRTNLRNTLGQLPQTITQGIGMSLPVDQQWAQYGQQVQQSLANGIAASARNMRTPVLSPTLGLSREDFANAGNIYNTNNQRMNDLRRYTGGRYSRTDFNYPRPLY